MILTFSTSRVTGPFYGGHTLTDHKLSLWAARRPSWGNLVHLVGVVGGGPGPLGGDPQPAKCSVGLRPESSTAIS